MTILLQSNRACDNKPEVPLKTTYAKTFILSSSSTKLSFSVLQAGYKKKLSKLKYLRENKCREIWWYECCQITAYKSLIKS